jgi:hypothetical protein
MFYREKPNLPIMKTSTLKATFSYSAAVIIFAIFLISCQKEKFTFPDPGTLPKGLTGSWVEISTGTDTIVFNSDIDSGFFLLSRGFGMTNGYYLPVIGSGPYSYKITGNSIFVLDGLSSSMQGGTFYFSFDEPNLTIKIGKFTPYISARKSILTFRKIK